ncbi:universal stress protein [Nocardia sp. CDC160]|uniref:universal stress protein n=1 Tax=Nocardia sp. CDC160 TaxID=3112166 RepID=UPI002DB59BC5|nr:universal stress protein [Nocardia sp. CDC160]MEC3918684.1 universal stress protein [Nocardia sp. CDC160]
MHTNASRSSAGGLALPVVAGIDGSSAAVRAAVWAGGEALARGVPLRLVRVVAEIDKAAFQPGGLRYREAEESLDEARRAVSDALPRGDGPQRLGIDVMVVRGQPEQVLVQQSRSAGLLALGCSGAGFLSQLVLGSTALAVTRAAACPVVLVRKARAEHGSVLVIVDDWNTAPAALRAGFEAARTRGGEVTVARIWHGRSWSAGPVWNPPAAVVSDAQIEHCLREFPDIAVRPVTIVGDLVCAVENFATTARLVVVAHDSDPGHPDRLGPVTQDLVRYAPCPVLVVPDRPSGAAAGDGRAVAR